MRLLRNPLALIFLASIVQFQFYCEAQSQPYTEPVSQQGAPRLSINEWFSRYDKIRFKAQMSPAEKQKADALMSKGFSILVPGDTKIETRNLLNKLSLQYKNAILSLNTLPRIPETLQLHKGYYQYFLTAYQLFLDYLKVQDNVLTVDPATGQPVAANLMQRKQALESLERSVKSLDQNMRQQYQINPYPY